MIIIYRNEKY